MLKREALKIIKQELENPWDLKWKQPCSKLPQCAPITNKGGYGIWGHADIHENQLSISVHPVKTLDYDLTTDVVLHEIAHARQMELVNFDAPKILLNGGHTPLWEELFIKMCEKFQFQIRDSFTTQSLGIGRIPNNTIILAKVQQ